MSHAINCSEKKKQKKTHTHRQVLVVENFIQCNCVSRSLVLHTGDHGPDPVGTPLHIRSVSISLYDGREVAFTAGYTLSPSHTSPSVFTVLSTLYPQSSRMQYSAVRRHFHSTNVTPTIIQHTKVLCRAKVQARHQQSCSIQKFCVEPSSSVTLIIHDARVAVYPHTLLTTLITHYSCRSEGYPLLILYTVVTFSTSPYRSPLSFFFKESPICINIMYHCCVLRHTFSALKRSLPIVSQAHTLQYCDLLHQALPLNLQPPVAHPQQLNSQARSKELYIFVVSDKRGLCTYGFCSHTRHYTTCCVPH